MAGEGRAERNSWEALDTRAHFRLDAPFISRRQEGARPLIRQGWESQVRFVTHAGSRERLRRVHVLRYSQTRLLVEGQSSTSRAHTAPSFFFLVLLLPQSGTSCHFTQGLICYGCATRSAEVSRTQQRASRTEERRERERRGRT